MPPKLFSLKDIAYIILSYSCSRTALGALIKLAKDIKEARLIKRTRERLGIRGRIRRTKRPNLPVSRYYASLRLLLSSTLSAFLGILLH